MLADMRLLRACFGGLILQPAPCSKHSGTQSWRPARCAVHGHGLGQGPVCTGQLLLHQERPRRRIRRGTPQVSLLLLWTLLEGWARAVACRGCHQSGRVECLTLQTLLHCWLPLPTISLPCRTAAPIANRIFFAGEHTRADSPATTHGALLSGRKAAADLLASLK